MTETHPNRDNDASTTRATNPVRATRRRKAALMVASVLAGIAIIELGFRIWGPGAIAPRRIDPGVPFVVRPGGRLEYLPNTEFASIYDPAADPRGYFDGTGRITYAINAYGFRGPALAMPKPPGVVRIACLGDSFTFGEGVRYEDTWPSVLAKRLNEEGLAGADRVDAINAGVQGYGLLDCLLWYGIRIEKFDPDIVVLAFFMNDLMDTTETIRINDAMHREENVTGLARYSKVADWIQHRRRATRLQEQYFASIRASFDATGRETLNEAFAGFQGYASQSGVRFVVVVFPVLWGLDGDYPLRPEHEMVAQACRAAGAEHIDLLDVFQGERSESLWVHATDQHPNEIAQSRAAEAIANQLLQK